MTKEFVVDRLLVRQFATREEMGRAAAGAVREQLLETLARKKEANVLFAAAPSQNELLSALVAAPDVPWERVNAFHMDEYVGLAEDAPRALEISCGGRFSKSSRSEASPISVAARRTWRLNAGGTRRRSRPTRWTSPAPESGRTDTLPSMIPTLRTFRTPGR